MLKRLVVAAVLLFCMTTAVLAVDRPITYPLQAIPSTQLNQTQRDLRLAIGNFLRDMLGFSGAGGIYSNLSIVPAGG